MASEPTPNGRINGDDEKNDLHGTPRPDEIDGWGNGDTIRGKGDDDTLWGGNGDDRIYGEDGNDTLWGGRGDDWLYGGNGNDVLVGGLDNDYLFGGAGADIFVGSAGNDELTGGAGTDRFEFVIADYSNGNDKIKDFENGEKIHFVNFKIGSKPIDITVFQVGNDTRIEYGSGKNFSTITLAGVGVDEVSKADFVGVGSLFRGVDVTATPAAEPIQATGSKEDFVVNTGASNEGSTRTDTIVGFSHGEDKVTFVNKSKNDAPEENIEISQAGKHTVIKYGDGFRNSITLENVVALDVTRDALGGIGTITRKIDDTNEANNSFQGTADNDVMDGKGGDDTIFGLNGNDALDGGLGNDTLHGGDGTDILKGGEGNDQLAGGTGNDVLTGGDGRDMFVFDESSNNGDDVITDFVKGDKEKIVFRNGDESSSTDVRISQVKVAVDDGFRLDTLIKYGESSITLTGKDALEIGRGQFDGLGTITREIDDTNEANKSFQGTADNDVMDGKGGDDTIFGLNGNDTLKGGVGNDTLLGGVGDDMLEGGAGNDTFVFDRSSGHDTIADFGVGTNKIKVLNLHGQSFEDLDLTEVRRVADNGEVVYDAVVTANVGDAVAFTITLQDFDYEQLTAADFNFIIEA